MLLTALTQYLPLSPHFGLSVAPRVHSRFKSFYCASSLFTKGGSGGGIEQLLCRPWFLQEPRTKIVKVRVERMASLLDADDPISCRQMKFSLAEPGICANGNDGMFYVIRDELLHPLMGGNKLRKLDALLPLLQAVDATDVVTCGGCQSAHTASIAVACAELGISAHLLLRGESPHIPTGYNLVSKMYGQVVYVPRSEYADRASILSHHAAKIAGNTGLIMWLHEFNSDSVELQDNILSRKYTRQHQDTSRRKVVVVKEGAGDAVALLGLIRLVHYLSQPSVFGRDDALQIIVDSGTGTTAVGIALGISLLGLPWKVVGVMLADTYDNYIRQQSLLLAEFRTVYGQSNFDTASSLGNYQLPLSWIGRHTPRRFGTIFPADVAVCQSVAQQTGILLDPMYTLAGWETAVHFCIQKDHDRTGTCRTVMLHTGGMLGLFGLAQRYGSLFR